MTEANLSYQQTPTPTGQPDSPLSINGRFGRISFLAWLFITFIVVFTCLVVGFMVLIGAVSIPPEQSGLLTGLSIGSYLAFAVLFIAFFYFMFIFAIRRLHDVNQTGWLSLLTVVPVINLVFYLYLFFAKGTAGPNNYGPQRVTKSWETVLGWIYIVLIALTIIAYYI